MRIVHTSLRYPPSSGGAEQYAHELVERTRSVEQGRDVRVLTSTLRTHGPISELDPKLLLNNPPYVQRLHHLKTPFVSYPRLQALPYYISHHQPDIIESYGFWYQPADTTARYARKYKIPFIFHPIYYENEIRQKLMWQVYKNTIGKKTFAAADVVAVISPFEQSLIQRAGFPVKRFELLPPGVDYKHYQVERPSLFNKRGITGSVLLSVSRISAGKGLESVMKVLPDIIKAYPDTHWVIVGEDFGAKSSLKKQAEAAGISKHVHWLGKLSENDKIAAFQHAHIFVHPSHYEAFGIVLAEASACGLPIVARNIAAIPYVTPHQKTGLLFNNDEELKQNLLTLLSSPSVRESLGSAGQKYILNNFTWDKTINRLLTIYGEFNRQK